MAVITTAAARVSSSRSQSQLLGFHLATLASQFLGFLMPANTVVLVILMVLHLHVVVMLGFSGCCNSLSPPTGVPIKLKY